MTPHLVPVPAVRTTGVLMPCPRCGEECANISMHLAELEFTCHECDGSFSADDLRTLIRRWAPMLGWVDTMPGGAE